jgi:site-specific recombinase XerD
MKKNRKTFLCFGETKTFDAGVFASYLWQDGSKARNLTTKNIGNYSVSVSKMLGHKNLRTTQHYTKILGR